MSLDFDIYFKKSECNSETNKIIEKFSPIIQKELHFFYQKFPYTFHVHKEKFDKTKPIKVNQVVIIFSLYASKEGVTLYKSKSI